MYAVGLPVVRPNEPAPAVDVDGGGWFVRHSGNAVHAGLQLLTIGATELQLSAVAEDDDVVPGEPGLQFLDPIQVHRHGAMDAGEHLRVERRLDPVHRLANQMRRLPDMYAYIVPRRLEPVDVGDLHEK